MKAKTLPPRFLAALLAGAILPLAADEIKMKSGQTYAGRITYEAADIVKIELDVSGSIKETKILARADIATITKDAPDDVAFGKLQKLVPTGSLVSVETYRQMLATGPEAFLKSFPTSKHAAKVAEIRDILAKELDQVERGFLKIEGEWISPQDKIDFKELVDSRVRLLRMDAFAKSPNVNSLISALREFEYIEENYLGTPAFPKAVELSQEAITSLGRQLQTLAANVDYQNAEFERSLAASTPESRAQITEARAREDKAHAERVAADKKAGVKWIQLNFRSKPAIDEYLKLAAAELTRLREYDPGALAAQAEQLVAVDKLIAANQIEEARAALATAASMTGQKVDSKSKSKSKAGAKTGSYLAILNAKISAKEDEAKEKVKAKAAASDSEALTANLKRAGAGETDPKGGEPGADGAQPGAEDAGMEKAAEPIDEFAALGAAKKKPAEADDAKGGTKESSGKSKAKSKTREKAESSGDDGEEDEGARKARPAAVEEDGGFPFWVIPGGITLIAVIGIVVMKVLGIGGKKGEGED